MPTGPATAKSEERCMHRMLHDCPVLYRQKDKQICNACNFYPKHFWAKTELMNARADALYLVLK
jgi:hypothetical protein